MSSIMELFRKKAPEEVPGTHEDLFEDIDLVTLKEMEDFYIELGVKSEADRIKLPDNFIQNTTEEE